MVLRIVPGGGAGVETDRLHLGVHWVLLSPGSERCGGQERAVSVP